MQVSIDTVGKMDIPYMAQLCGQEAQDIVEVLKSDNLIYLNPLKSDENDPFVGWEESSEYLSGNVREKLRTAEKELLPDSAAKLGMMRVRTAYEAGRDSAVKNFVEQAKLLQYIKGIGLDREAFLHFAHYMEALVAYHRYYGGKD